MGYSTDFEGVLKFNRELTHKEWLELKKLADYDSKDDGTYESYTETPDTIPDAYLQWEPTEDGDGIQWNGAEKFYEYIHWLRWLIKHYMKPRDLVLNGEIKWQGEEIGDVGILVCVDNKVTTKKLTLEGVVVCPNCNHKFKPEA
jgi:hypothetical protein